jgi:cation:H+ antiporter
MDGLTAAGNLPVNAILGLVALVMLVVSANEAVRRFCGLAEYLNLSTTFMGMTVVSLATSIPEISTKLIGSIGILRGTLDYRITSAVVVGSTIGSDIVQQTLILGLVAIVAGTLYFRRYVLIKDMLPMVAAQVMCTLLAWDRTYSRLDGAILFGGFALYMYYLYQDERKFYRKPILEGSARPQHQVHAPQSRREAARYALFGLGAMAGTVVSASILLDLTEVLVQATHVGGSFIGVAIIGVASALPELTTALAAVRNGERGICLGTLIGSNITNPLAGVGMGALASTYWVPPAVAYWDLPAAVGSSSLIWALLWLSRGKLNRWGGLMLMAMYAVYLGFRAVFFLVD